MTEDYELEFEPTPDDNQPADSDGDEPRRYYPETGHWVSGPFLSFLEHYGPVLCGYPVSDVVVENGVRSQYFQCIALEEHTDGRVRLKPLGESYLSLRQLGRTAEVPAPSVVDVRQQLRRDPSQHYPTRPLSDIRYLVIHHTGAPAHVGPEQIAVEHVETNGWPGMGYHYVVDPSGAIYFTQDLTTVSFHARQFNPVSVGVALLGDLSSALPSASQLDASADLLARLLQDLGLPPDAIRGHREMVPTPCPGDSFLRVWKPGLMQAIAARLEAPGVDG